MHAFSLACVAGVRKGRGREFGVPHVSLAPKTPFPFPFKRLPRRLAFSLACWSGNRGQSKSYTCRVFFFFRVIQMRYYLWKRGVQGYEKMSLIFPWSCVNESWITIACFSNIPWSRKWIKALFVLNMALVNSVCSEQRTH